MNHLTRRLLTVGLVAAPLLALSQAAPWPSKPIKAVVPFAAGAASGTWSHAGGGSWTNAANWGGGVIADGSGNTANFAAVSLSADAIVTLDLPRSIGNLNFDDQSPTKHNWFLNSGSSGSLELMTARGSILIRPASASRAIAVSMDG